MHAHAGCRTYSSLSSAGQRLIRLWSIDEKDRRYRFSNDIRKRFSDKQRYEYHSEEFVLKAVYTGTINWWTEIVVFVAVLSLQRERGLFDFKPVHNRAKLLSLSPLLSLIFCSGSEQTLMFVFIIWTKETIGSTYVCYLSATLCRSFNITFFSLLSGCLSLSSNMAFLFGSVTQTSCLSHVYQT